MEYVGIDWAYRRAAWCALSEAGKVVGEGAVSADEDGLGRLVIKCGVEVRAVVGIAFLGERDFSDSELARFELEAGALPSALS